MKMFFALALVACLLTLGVVLTIEAPLALLFGWVPFLWRVLPQVTADRPSLVAGGVAFILFMAGIHWTETSWCRQRQMDTVGPVRTWKFRSSLAIVVGVCLLFVAGISLVGIVHQGIWLFGSDRPLVEEVVQLKHGSSSPQELKCLTSGVVRYQDEFDGRLPPAGSFTLEGGAPQSWETHLLPHLGYSIREIDCTKPWDAPENQRPFKCVVPNFINPGLRVSSLTDEDGYGLSHYAANVHIFASDRKMRWGELSNSASRTILFGEVNGEFKPWAQPANWRDPTSGINRSPHGFGGPPRSGGALFSMADGSVRFVSDKVNPEVLRVMSTPREKGLLDDLDEAAPRR